MNSAHHTQPPAPVKDRVTALSGLPRSALDAIHMAGIAATLVDDLLSAEDPRVTREQVEQAIFAVYQTKSMIEAHFSLSIGDA